MSPERLRLVQQPEEGLHCARIEPHTGTVVSYVVTGEVLPPKKPETWDINKLAFDPTPVTEVLSPAQTAIQKLDHAYDRYKDSTDALARTHIDEANFHSGQLAKLRLEDVRNETKKTELSERALAVQGRVYEAQDNEQQARSERDEAQANHDALHDQRQSVFAMLTGMVAQCEHRTVKNRTDNAVVNDELRDLANKILEITERSSAEELSELMKLQERVLNAETHLARRQKEHEASEWVLNAANEDLGNIFADIEKLQENVSKTGQVHQKQNKNVQKGGKHARREIDTRKRLERVRLIGWLASRLLPESPAEIESSQTIRLAEVEI